MSATPDDLLAGMNRLAIEMRDNREETRRLRETLEKMIAIEPRKKKGGEDVADAIETLGPLVKKILGGGGGRRR